MKYADKIRVRDAFQKAIDRDPVAADLPVEGWSRDGRPMTSRDIIRATLRSEDFYVQIDAAIASGRRTLEGFLETFANYRLPLKDRSKPKPSWKP